MKKPVHIGKHDIFVPFIFPLHIGITQQLEETLFMNGGGGVLSVAYVEQQESLFPIASFVAMCMGLNMAEYV